MGTYSDDAVHAFWNNRIWGDPSHGVIIRNNEISWVKTKNGQKGAIEFSNADGLMIEKNYNHELNVPEIREY